MEDSLDVSIHAPVMDANIGLKSYQQGRGFNPRARDGRERSTPIFAGLAACFNPRARDGRE